MRLTGGRWGGRSLRSARGVVRPTSDRVRESIFARLGDLDAASVLDLYAGTGALGLEALSRGAGSLVCVERAPQCLAALRANVERLGAGAAVEVISGDASRALRRLARSGARFDLVFLDPPYASDELERALAGLREHGLLRPGALVVIERSRRHSLPDGHGLEVLDERRHGDTLVTRLVAPDGVNSEAGDGGSVDLQRDRHPPPGRDEDGIPIERRSAPERTTPEMSDAQRAKRIALFPASFDPVTNGHLDIVDRSLQVFDELVLGIAENVAKTGSFTIEERMEMLDTVLGHDPRIRVTTFDTLTVEFAKQIGAQVVIRGVRAMSDFEYEFEMALMNRHLQPEVETVFMMASQEYLYVSSSRLKELARFGRNVDEFVPPSVAKKLVERLGRA